MSYLLNIVEYRSLDKNFREMIDLKNRERNSVHPIEISKLESKIVESSDKLMKSYYDSLKTLKEVFVVKKEKPSLPISFPSPKIEELIAEEVRYNQIIGLQCKEIFYWIISLVGLTLENTQITIFECISLEKIIDICLHIMDNSFCIRNRDCRVYKQISDIDRYSLYREMYNLFVSLEHTFLVMGFHNFTEKIKTILMMNIYVSTIDTLKSIYYSMDTYKVLILFLNNVRMLLPPTILNELEENLPYIRETLSFSDEIINIVLNNDFNLFVHNYDTLKSIVCIDKRKKLFKLFYGLNESKLLSDVLQSIVSSLKKIKYEFRKYIIRKRSNALLNV